MIIKRQFEKKTLLNSVDIEKRVINLIATAMKKMWEFSFTEDGNNRSTTKTDYLHTNWENALNDSFGDYKDAFNEYFDLNVEKEQIVSKQTNRIKDIVDIFGSKFKVDMLMSHNSIIHTVFLLKAPLTSINKNRYNSALNNFGEIDRFYGNPENKNIELVFVNFTPKKTFTIDNKNNTIKKEIVQYLGLNKDDNGEKPIDKLPKSTEIKQKIHEIHIEYELNFSIDLDLITTKDELKKQIKSTPNFVILQDDSIKELKDYIKDFINKNNNVLQINLDY